MITHSLFELILVVMLDACACQLHLCAETAPDGSQANPRGTMLSWTLASRRHRRAANQRAAACAPARGCRCCTWVLMGNLWAFSARYACMRMLMTIGQQQIIYNTYIHGPPRTTCIARATFGLDEGCGAVFRAVHGLPVLCRSSCSPPARILAWLALLVFFALPGLPVLLCMLLCTGRLCALASSALCSCIGLSCCYNATVLQCSALAWVCYAAVAW
jgi:hypothetical protein